MINGKNFFDQPINNDAYENIRKIATGQGYDYKTSCLLNYPYLKSKKMIAIDLSKKQTLDSDPTEFNRLILLQIQIEQEIQQCFSFLKKQQKLCYTFHKEL